MSMFDVSENDDYSDEEEESKNRSEIDGEEEDTEEADEEGEGEDQVEDEEEEELGSEEDEEKSNNDVDENDNVRKHVKKEKMPEQTPQLVIEKSNIQKNEKREKVLQNAISVIPTERLKADQKANKKQEVATPEEPGKKKITLPKDPNSLAASAKRPSTQAMVDQALTALNERAGSSIVAIKRYIVTNFSNFDENRIGIFIAKYIKKSIAEGKIKQNKRKFKLIVKKKKTPIKTAARPTAMVKTDPKRVKSTKKEAIPKDKIVIKPKKIIEPTTSADVLKAKKSKKTTKSTESFPTLDVVPKQLKTKKTPNNDTDIKVPKKMSKKENLESINKAEPPVKAFIEKPTSKHNPKKTKSQKTKN